MIHLEKLGVKIGGNKNQMQYHNTGGLFNQTGSNLGEMINQFTPEVPHEVHSSPGKNQSNLT